MIKVNLIFGAVGIIFLILKYRNLAFKEIKGSFTQEQVFEAIKRSDMDYNWNLQSRNKFLHRILTREHFITPGKLLTIIHLEDKILFNGIRNPSFSAPRGETFRPSIKEFKVFQKHLNDVVSGMEYVKKKEFNDTQWNWKMILIRLFLYPFCIFLLSFSFFYLIPNKEFVISIPLVAISLVYLFVDLYMIFTSMKNNS
ncbi:MAG: hypothetical protein H6582_00975 [Crocinitomicaceae bacterium]|nr:hypothetical protein [Crocinitomicaceae bacterium]